MPDLVDPTGGRAALEKLLAGHTARTQRLAAQVARAVAAAVARGEDPVQAVQTGMEAVGMAKAIRDIVATSVVQSVCIGYGIWPTVSALPPEAMGTLRTTALSGVWDDKGMILSQALHGTDKSMRDEIVQAVKGHIDAKVSAWDAQRGIYDGYGFGGAIHKNKLPGLPKDLQDLADKARKVLSPEDYAQLKADAKRLRAYADRLATGPLRAAYGQMADRLEKGLTHGLNRLVKTATEEKARYHASRILRTETANAWGQGFVQECAENPDVVAIRWKTSSAHKIFDVCDFCATANLYGMGPGVYPKAKLPRYCAHPHCFCNLLKVFIGQVPVERDNVDAGGRAALAGMTESQRARLLTIKGKEAFGQSGQWRGSLRHYEAGGGNPLSQGAKAVLEEAKVLAGPPLERKAWEAIARVDQIIRRADTLEKGGRPITGSRAAAIQKSIEKALAVEYPAKIKTTSGRLTAEQKDGMNRLSNILSERAVPGGVTVSVSQIPATGRSSHLDGKIKIRKNASPGIMAHELMHAADAQNQELFRAIADQRAKGTVGDDFQPFASGGYANRTYPRGSTEYLTRGVEHIMERARTFRKADPDWFKRSVELLRGEWVAR